MYGKNPRSTAQIGGHPLHPMLIPLPITCFIGVLVTDILFLSTGEQGWATASNWLLGFGLATAALAAATGFIDYMGDDRIRRLGPAIRHMIANVTVVVLEIVNLAVRLTNPDDGTIGSLGVYLSGIAVLVLGYSGWLGGELVYRHRVGVQETVDEFSGYDDGHAEAGASIPRGPALHEKSR
jgi:uncharacterized membrane protein